MKIRIKDNYFRILALPLYAHWSWKYFVIRNLTIRMYPHDFHPDLRFNPDQYGSIRTLIEAPVHTFYIPFFITFL